MPKLNLYKISEKLLETTDKYETQYPKYKTFELQYIQEFDRLLLESQSIFGNQPSREAYARQELRKLDFYDKFIALEVEINLLRNRMRNLQQISKNLISGNFMGGGDNYE